MMWSIFYLSLLNLLFWNILQTVRTDHCEAKYDVTLAPPKIDDKNYKPPANEEADSCSISYLSILNPDESPTADDKCIIRGFHLNDGTVGPSCIPEIGRLPRDEFFSINMDSHREEAGKLFGVLYKCSTFEDFKNAALYYKGKVNPMLFSHVFSTAIINRPDTSDFPTPSLHQTKPDLFFNDKIIDKAKQQLNKNVKKSRKEHEKQKYLESENKPKKEHIILKSKPQQYMPAIPPIMASPPALMYIPPASPPVYMDSPPDLGNPPVMESPPTDDEGESPPESEDMPDDKPVPQGSPPKHNLQRKLAVLEAPPESNIIKEDQPETMNKKNPEYKMCYFREDIALNSHHNNFHSVFPLFWGRDLPRKDRKGEFFYYMHSQMIRRYNGDRLAVGLKFVKPLNITQADTNIEDGYYPHLSAKSTGQSYSGRSRNLKLRDVRRKYDTAKVGDIVKWINIVISAINDGYIIDYNGDQIPLDEVNGIDLLGSAVEASDYSPNRPLYGDIHNRGHVLLSFIHDDVQEFNAPPSVMYTPATALRDPVFWRWHKMVDDLINLHKARLPPYSNTDLNWNDIHINSIHIQSKPTPGRDTEDSFAPDSCYTFIRNRLIDISRGLDFNAKSKVVRVDIKHLDHSPFNYIIKVNSKSESPVDAHVRIFISPKHNDHHKLATDEELRRNAIEMDRFTIKLNPGDNTIDRSSRESAVTMLPGSQWDKISDADMEFLKSDENNGQKGICGCGWPDHLLVPRGTAKGIKYVLFVMVSNWSKEKVGNPKTYRKCGSSLTMCGLLNEKFPDRRAMGFPLDRPILKKNWFKRSNMKKKDITIYHLN